MSARLATLTYTARYSSIYDITLTFAVPVHNTTHHIVLCRHTLLRYMMYTYYVGTPCFAILCRHTFVDTPLIAYDVPVLCGNVALH